MAALCDIDDATLSRRAGEHGIEGRFTEFSQMLEHVDAVVVATPMQLHASQSLEALAAGKHVLSEVTACVTLDECWALQEAAESAAAQGKVYAMAENYCWLKECVLVRELAREGLFGTPYYGEGAYIHEVRNYHHALDGTPTWRARWQVGQRGCTYGTHSLGPVMHWMKAASPAEHIVSVSCVGSGVHTDPEHPHDDTCLMLCQLASGKLVQIRLDMMSNRPHLPAYYALQGTNGVYEASRLGGEGRLWLGESIDGAHREWSPASEFYRHLPESYVREEAAAKESGHGGADWFVGRDFVAACRGEKAPDTDLYDALEWTAAGILSTVSIERDGAPVPVPNFR